MLKSFGGEDTQRTGPQPVFVGSQVQSTSTPPLYELYEGILTRSISAAASSLISTSSTVFTMRGQVGGPGTREQSSEPESLSLPPTIGQMPDHDVVDTDPEEEFMFDARHFDKSSSSTSVSNSFEIIDEDI